MKVLRCCSDLLRACQEACNRKVPSTNAYQMLIPACRPYSSTLIPERLTEENETTNYPLTPSQKYAGEELSSTGLPSVTRVLRYTKPVESELALLAWKKKMVSQLGEEGFAKMQQETLRVGSNCHSAIESFLNGTPLEEIEAEESCEKLWSSVQPVLKDIDTVVSVEDKVIHPHLKYYGYVDCIALYKGKLCSIDWKTSQKIRRSLNECYDDPVQVAAYAGAMNCSKQSENQICAGLVVKIYHDGRPATPFLMNKFTLEFYWMQWLKRLATYNQLQSNASAS